MPKQILEGKFEYAVCPYLKNGRCSIYETRFACCRNFPQETGFCSKSKNCLLVAGGIRKNTKKSSAICEKCKDNCCTKILVPAGTKVTKKFIAHWINISCQKCKKLF